MKLSNELFNTLLILLSLLLLLQYCCASNDSLAPHQFIKDGDVLVSSGGAYSLGFFSLGSSSRRYLGIWFNKVLEKTVVWVANRDAPLNDTTGFITINSHGCLVLLCLNRTTPLWSSTNVSSLPSKANMMAKLLDTGNLVLSQADNNKTVVWQSFDYPTHTLLQSMKLGLDRRTGLNRFLTSWKSADDPGTGNLAYRIDPTGFPQLFLYKGTDPVWRTGPWNGMRWSGVPEMTNKSTLYRDTEFVNNPDELYMAINTLDASIRSRLVMDFSGSVQLFTWSDTDPKWNRLFSGPTDQCDNYGLCGAYSCCNPYNPNEFACRCLPGYEPKSPRNWSMRDGAEGCVRKRTASPMCGKGEGFVKVERVKLPDTSKALANTSMSLKNCKEECLSNCSCIAYASADIRGGGSGCVTWYGDLIDTREYMYINGGQDFYLRVDATELANYEKKKSFSNKKEMLAILAVSVALLLLLVIFLVYCLIRRKRKGKEEEPFSAHFQDNPMSKEFCDTQTSSDLPFFDLSTIIAATDNFSITNKLGEGGFGPVYKGQLPNGQEIAVKRLSKGSGQGPDEFKNEVTLIAKLQHRNLVRLIGCCIQKEEKMLVYEYLHNKSLDFFIFNETKRLLLDWRKRFEIICGIARGILYLHEDSRLRIIHRDLKASNVLLDATLNPKISDFGMARIFGVDQIEANTNRVVGTYGYMSPEYAMEGLFSVKSDVYSFGVLLLEIVAGRKNSSFHQNSSSSNLIGHIWNLWKEEKAMDIVDSALAESYPAQEVLRCIQIGLLCVQECASDRPTMFTVVFMLGNDTALPSPRQPAFILKKTYSSADPSTASEGSSSTTANVLTVTMAEGR